MKSIKVYSLAELKDQFPESYDKVFDKWRDQAYQDEIPWAGEIIDSLKAVIKVCGGKLTDWSIWPESHSSFLRVDVEDYWEEEIYGQEDDETDYKDVPKDAAWFERELAEVFGAEKQADGGLKFPGACKLTGYCADDDFAEAVYKELQRGSSLKGALESLAHDASKMLEAEQDDMASEDRMIDSYEDCYFTEDGQMV